MALKEVVRQRIDAWKAHLVNDFETSLFQKYPELRNLKERLYDNGAVYASMTGSGSSIYGLFKEPIDFRCNDTLNCKWGRIIC